MKEKEKLEEENKALKLELKKNVEEKDKKEMVDKIHKLQYSGGPGKTIGWRIEQLYELFKKEIDKVKIEWAKKSIEKRCECGYKLVYDKERKTIIPEKLRESKCQKR